MLKGILASNASKLIAACVCPVAGSVALTVGVPQVRDAVHRATKPRAYALPKTRTRRPAASLPSEPIRTAALVAPPCAPTIDPGQPLNATVDLDGLTQVADLSGIGDLPVTEVGALVPDIVPDTNTPVLPEIPGVPEPRTWMQMLVGFGLIGGAARYSLKGTRGVVQDEVPTPDTVA